MEYKVTGQQPIATSKGDVEPGGTLDGEDLAEYVNVDALVSAGHLKAVEDKPPAGSKAAGSK